MVQIQCFKTLLHGKILEEKFRSVTKKSKNQREFDAWNFPDPKSPKMSMSVIVIGWKNKFYKGRILVEILLLGRLNKFLLVINLTGNVFFWTMWISENWKKLLPLNIMRCHPLSFRNDTKLRLIATYSYQQSTKYNTRITVSSGNLKHVVNKNVMCLTGLALFLFWFYL